MDAETEDDDMGTAHRLQALREELLDRADVFDRPRDYRAGVEDALDRVFLTLSRQTVDTPTPADELPPAGAWFG